MLISARALKNSNTYKTHIATSKKEATKEYARNTDSIQAYCDGSDHQGNNSTSAILFKSQQFPCILLYYLSTDEEHTSFEAKVVRLLLAAELIVKEVNLTFMLSIFIDNQAAIQSGEEFYTYSGMYLID